MVIYWPVEGQTTLTSWTRRYEQSHMTCSLLANTFTPVLMNYKQASNHCRVVTRKRQDQTNCRHTHLEFLLVVQCNVTHRAGGEIDVSLFLTLLAPHHELCAVECIVDVIKCPKSSGICAITIIEWTLQQQTDKLRTLYLAIVCHRSLGSRMGPLGIPQTWLS